MKRFILTLNILLICGYFFMLSAAFDSKVIFNQGLEAFKAANYSSAELLFRKTLENDDDFRDRAWFYLARTVYQQNKYKAAIFEFNSFLTKCRTESLRIESRFWIAESYYYLKDSLKAIEEYNRFLEKTTDISLILTAHDRIATIYFSQERYEEAIIEWEKSIKNSTDMDQNAQIVLKIGRALYQNKDYQRALERLLPLLSARINSQNKAESRLLVGRIYQLQDEHKKAILALNAIPKELTETYPFFDVYYFRALSYMSMGREISAKSELEVFQLIGKKSEYYNAGMFELGRILLAGNKPESGIEILHALWEDSANPTLSIKSAILLAEFYLDNDPYKAITYTEKYQSVEDNELNITILLLLARAYMKTEKYDKADSVILKYTEKYPYDQNIDEIKFMRGVVLLQKGELDAALEIFNNIKRDNPFSKFLSDTDYYMALVSYKKKRIDEAVSYLENYILKKGVNKLFEAHYLLAEIYISEADLKKAEKEVNILINKYPKYTNVDKILFMLAKSMFENNVKKAQNYFNILQYKYPESSYTSTVNLLYGNSNFENKKYEKAIIFYEKYLNSNSDESRGIAYYNLLQANYNIRDYGRVIEIIKNIKIPILDEIQWKELPLLQARSYYNLNNYEQVYLTLRWLNIADLNNNDVKMLIDSTIRTGDIKAVSEMIDNLVDRENLQREMQILLADYYANIKNYDAAKNLYNMVLVSGAEEPLKEKGRISLAEIYAETGDYELSLNLLNQVELKENVAARDCLIIINHFYNGKEKRGAEITLSRLNFILETRFTEKVLLLNMLYYYNQKDVFSFNKYVKLLAPYEQNKDYVNYLSGKLFFETGANRQSYLSFYKLSISENEYSTETNYYLGKLSLLYNNNRSGSIKYYQKVLEDENKKNEFVQKSKLELAIIYNEMKNYDLSRNLLNELLAENDKGRYRIQAENLLELFSDK